MSILRTVDLDSHEAGERPHYRATLYASLVWTRSAVYFQKCNTASSQTKRRLAVTPVRESSPADKDRLTDDKNIEDHVPCYQANLKSTVSKHQALKGVQVRTHDEFHSSAYWTWVATHFRGLVEPFSWSAHGDPPRESNANLSPTITDRIIPASPCQSAFLQHSPA